MNSTNVTYIILFNNNSLIVKKVNSSRTTINIWIIRYSSYKYILYYSLIMSTKLDNTTNNSSNHIFNIGLIAKHAFLLHLCKLGFPKYEPNPKLYDHFLSSSSL